MYKFFVEPSAVVEHQIMITGDDVNHIKNVLRMQKAEQVYVSVGDECEYLCEIAELEDEQVLLNILDMYKSARELKSKITLFQCLPKGDKMETIIQKAVELGAYRIVPVMSSRVIVKLDEKKAKKKVERWNAISESAAKQSKRNVIPEVLTPVSFKEAIAMAGDLEGTIIPYENAKGIAGARATIEDIKSCGSIGVLIGPEGGFSQEEVELATSAGVIPITLGNRILRTETAGLCALSILMFAIEEDA